MDRVKVEVNRASLSFLILFCTSWTIYRVGMVDSQTIAPTLPTATPLAPTVANNASVDQLITPSDKCKEIVGRFASAVSNFTLCSVSNARPIHLCEWCIGDYLQVSLTHATYFSASDDKGNPCREYFTNLDRIEIVSDAYNYVANLWRKGSCDYCFQKDENGTLLPRINEDVSDFKTKYEFTQSCFNAHMTLNDTCQNCTAEYEELNSFYIGIETKYGDHVCLDVIDTMNTTREMWSEVFNCFPKRRPEMMLHIYMGLVGVVPLIFYFMTYVMSAKQETAVRPQRRLAEMFNVTSSSGEMSGYLSSRFGRSENLPPGGTASVKT